jgi:hypothetical protein
VDPGSFKLPRNPRCATRANVRRPPAVSSRANAPWTASLAVYLAWGDHRNPGRRRPEARSSSAARSEHLGTRRHRDLGWQSQSISRHVRYGR